MKSAPAARWRRAADWPGWRCRRGRWINRSAAWRDEVVSRGAGGIDAGRLTVIIARLFCPARRHPPPLNPPITCHAKMELDSLLKLVQIIVVDLVLAGDNAIVIGLVAAKFSPEQRRRVIFYGVGAAVLLRIVFAAVTVQLLQIIGILLAGGILLLWVCWKLWRDLRAPPQARPAADGAMDAGVDNAEGAPSTHRDPPMRSAIWQIVVADVSMSLDNVLAVAGIAEGHTLLLVFGLALSVALMAFAATLIANLLERHRWIGYVGLLMILYVALKMIYTGTLQLL